MLGQRAILSNFLQAGGVQGGERSLSRRNNVRGQRGVNFVPVGHNGRRAKSLNESNRRSGVCNTDLNAVHVIRRVDGSLRKNVTITGEVIPGQNTGIAIGSQIIHLALEPIRIIDKVDLRSIRQAILTVENSQVRSRRHESVGASIGNDRRTAGNLLADIVNRAKLAVGMELKSNGAIGLLSHFIHPLLGIGSKRVGGCLCNRNLKVEGLRRSIVLLIAFVAGFLLLFAAGGERKDHRKCQKKCKKLFH